MEQPLYVHPGSPALHFLNRKVSASVTLNNLGAPVEGTEPLKSGHSMLLICCQTQPSKQQPVAIINGRESISSIASSWQGAYVINLPVCEGHPPSCELLCFPEELSPLGLVLSTNDTVMAGICYLLPLQRQAPLFAHLSHGSCTSVLQYPMQPVGHISGGGPPSDLH